MTAHYNRRHNQPLASAERLEELERYRKAGLHELAEAIAAQTEAMLDEWAIEGVETHRSSMVVDRSSIALRRR